MGEEVTVAIGCATAGPPTWKLVMSLLGMVPHVNGPFTFSRVEGQAPDEARNHLGRWFLEHTDAEKLLFVDRDAILHPQTPQRLASWDVDIVGALCFTRYRPVVPTVYEGAHPDSPDEYQIRVHETRDWIRANQGLWTSEPAILEPVPEDSLTRVDFTGAHCLMVSRQVLETVAFPWFQAHTIDPERLGEDRYFCEKARAAGFPVYVDRSVVAGHMYGEGSLGALDFLVWDAVVDWQTKEINIPFANRRDKEAEVY
uniref:Glycosyltransferase n=1 Tax=viral metagenome TaxID=1070528 RepID=A0A6M3KPK1_9ZZZZ